MAHNPKPWDTGYIPKPGAKARRQFKLPPGWRDVSDRNWTCFAYGNAGGVVFGLPYARIHGKPGVKWQMYVGSHALPGVFCAPDMESTSLQVLFTWWAVEQSNAPAQPVGWDPGKTMTGRWVSVSAPAVQNLPRQLAKQLAHAGAYGAGVIAKWAVHDEVVLTVEGDKS